MKKRLFLGLVGCLAQFGLLSAQGFSAEFSAEMQKVDGKMEVAPQLKGILELPLGKAWATEMELASSQAGLDYRIDAKFDFGAVKRKLSAGDKSGLPLSLLFGASSGDACRTHFADFGLAAAWEKYECTAIFHYAPFADSQDKYLEITAQRNIGCVYLQPGVYINHAAGDFSFTGVLTVGISLDIQ